MGERGLKKRWGKGGEKRKEGGRKEGRKRREGVEGVFQYLGTAIS